MQNTTMQVSKHQMKQMNVLYQKHAILSELSSQEYIALNKTSSKLNQILGK